MASSRSPTTATSTSSPTSSSGNGDFRSTTSARCSTRSDNTFVCSSSCNAWTTSNQFAPDLDYATTVSSLPKCPRRLNMDRTSTLSSSRTLCSRQLVEPRHCNSFRNSRSIGLVHTTCDNNEFTECSKLRDNRKVSSRQHHAAEK